MNILLHTPIMCAFFKQEQPPKKIESRTDEQAFIHGLIFDFQQYRDLLPETIRGGKLIEQEEKILDAIQADLTRAAKFKAIEVDEFKRLMDKRRTELRTPLTRGIFKPVIKELTENLLPRFINEYTTFREEKISKKETTVNKKEQPEDALLIARLQEILADEQARNTKRLGERGRFIFQTIITYTKNLTTNDPKTLERLKDYIEQIDTNSADKKALAHLADLVTRYKDAFKHSPDEIARHARVDENLHTFQSTSPEGPLPKVNVKKTKIPIQEERHARVAAAFNTLEEPEKPYVQAYHPAYLQQLLKTQTVLRPEPQEPQKSDNKAASLRATPALPPEALPVEILRPEQIVPLTEADIDLQETPWSDDILNSVNHSAAKIEPADEHPSDSKGERLMSEESLERLMGQVDAQIDPQPKPASRKLIKNMTQAELTDLAQKEQNAFEDLMGGLDNLSNTTENPEKQIPKNRPTIPFSLEDSPRKPRSVTLPNGSTAEYVGELDAEKKYEGRGILKISGTPYDRLVIAYFDQGNLRHPESVSVQFEVQTERGNMRVTSTGPTDDNYLTHGPRCLADLKSPIDHAEFEGPMEHGIPTSGTITYLSIHEDPTHIYEGPVSKDFLPISDQGTWRVPGAEQFKPEHTLHLTADEAKDLESLPPTTETKEISPIQQKLFEIVNKTRDLLVAKIKTKTQNADQIRNYELPILDTFEEILFDSTISSDEERFKEIDTYRDTVESYFMDHFEDPLTNSSEIFDLLSSIDTFILQIDQQKTERTSTDKIKPIQEVEPSTDHIDSIQAIEVLKLQIDSKLPGFTDQMFSFIGELLLSYPEETEVSKEFLDIESILVYINSFEYEEDFTAKGIADVCKQIQIYLKNSQADQDIINKFIAELHKLLTNYLQNTAQDTSPEAVTPLPPLIATEAEPVAPHPFEQEDPTIIHAIPLPTTGNPPIEEQDMVDPTDNTYSPNPIHVRAEQGIPVETKPKPEKSLVEVPSIIVNDSEMMSGLQEGVLRAQEVAAIEREKAENAEIQKILQEKVTALFSTVNKQRGTSLPDLHAPSAEFFARFNKNYPPTLRNLFTVTTNMRLRHEQHLAADQITVADIHFAFQTKPPLFALLPSTRAKERHRVATLSSREAQEWYSLEVILIHINEISN